MNFEEFKKETVARIERLTGMSVLQELLFSYGAPNREKAIREYIRALEDELRPLLDNTVDEEDTRPKASLLLRVAELEKNFRGMAVEVERLAAPTDTTLKLRRYGYLAANPYRSDEEDREVNELREGLRQGKISVGFEPEARLKQPLHSVSGPPTGEDAEDTLSRMTGVRRPWRVCPVFGKGPIPSYMTKDFCESEASGEDPTPDEILAHPWTVDIMLRCGYPWSMAWYPCISVRGRQYFVGGYEEDARVFVPYENLPTPEQIDEAFTVFFRVIQEEKIVEHRKEVEAFYSKPPEYSGDTRGAFSEETDP